MSSNARLTAKANTTFDFRLPTFDLRFSSRSEDPPARTTFEAAGLVAGARVEIEAIATV